MTKRMCVFLYEGFQLLDAAGPIAAFELADRLAPDSYCVSAVSIAGGAIVSSSGLPLVTERADADDFPDTLIVSGGPGVVEAQADAGTMAYLGAAATTVRRLCSVCSGAALLGSAGLLDGRKATTHWRLGEELQRRFPNAQVEVDRIHVRDGRVWTSGGVTAGIDLALALVAEDCGEQLARRVAQEMVVYYRRPGGQSQFSALAELSGGQTPFSSLLDWIRCNLSERLTIELLAEQAAMSPRNFSRAFSAATGVSPAKAVERLRLEAARERVENSRVPIEQIASACGFGDPERMRRSFIRNFGQPPQALRRTQAR